MDVGRQSRIERIVRKALARHHQDRASFLAHECAGDLSLMREVQALLASRESKSNPPDHSFVEGNTDSNDPEITRPASWAGTTVGHYQVEALIGAGGMGEVYAAHDLRLERKVAIKTLPQGYAEDPERLARLEREARLLASLHHPHIAAIFGLEEWKGSRCLVLEFVEGETLAERLKRGRPPIGQSLDLLTQIADALEAAHEKGIIHRDLKPANIKITPDGKAKVLDFGLAKALHSGDSSDLTQIRTSDPFATRSQVIVGTPSYMSPEQARGETVTRGTDIWAFGALLYEMLTGQLAFPGRTMSDRLAAVLSKEPEWNSLPASTPNRIRTLAMRCLQKDMKKRLRDIGDARIELEGAVDGAPVMAVTKPAFGRWRLPLGIAMAAVIITALLVGSRWLRLGVTNSTETFRMSVMLPPGVSVTHGPGVAPSVALSPDGRMLVVAGTDTNGQRLYRRFLNKLEATPLEGTEGGLGPFFSPDGEWIGFYADGRVRRIPVGGGAPLDITTVPGAGFFGGAAWTPDDRIIFSFGACEQLHVVSSSGGIAQRLGGLGNDSNCHLMPELLPDGRTLLWSTWSGNDNRIEGVNLGSGRRSPIAAGNAARFAERHLILARGANLIAEPFDASRTEMTGSVTPLAEGVLFEPGAGLTHYAVSRNGTMAYVPSAGIYDLVLIDEHGAERLLTQERMFYQNPQFSPEGLRVAVAANRPGFPSDIWIHDLQTGTASQLTFEGGRAPVWTPNGTAITFSHLGERQGIYTKLADGSANAQRILAIDEFHWLIGWSPDGRTLAYGRILSTLKEGISATSFETFAAGKSKQIMKPGPLWGGRLSPDGHWLAYYSLESGHFEVYVTPFPRAETKWSIAEGSDPAWAQDGQEIYYRNGNRLEAVRIDSGTTIRVLSRRRVVEPFSPPLYDDYDVHPDGRTLVLVRPTGYNGGREIVVVVNALAELNP